MKKAAFLILLIMAALALGAAEPTFELVASSTNIVLSEQVQVSLVLRLPPKYGQRDNSSPPHVICPFLDANWKTAVFDRGDPRAPLAPKQGSPFGENAGPVFTLNNYVELMDLQRIPFTTVEREKDGFWRLTVVAAPWRATVPGMVRLDPVTVKVPFFAGMQRERDPFGHTLPFLIPVYTNLVLRTQPLTLTVSAPSKGRPASWCGAVSSDLTVSAVLSTNVCTAGVPLMFKMEIAGASNPSDVKPPDLAAALTGTVFRVDTGSLKAETQGGVRRFRWRVKPLEPGTVEFPSLPISYYDIDRNVYETCKTAPIPVQVVAGLQAAPPEKDDALPPQPDGIDLDPRGAESHPLLPHLSASIILFLLPPVLFMGIRFAPPVRRRIAASNAAYRKARAFAVCRRALKSSDAARRAAAIRRFFTVRYGVNGAAVTAVDAQRLMAPDYSEEDVALVVVNLQTHDAQTYAVKPGAGALVLLLVAGFCLGGSARAEVDAARAAFSYQRASTLAVQAADEAGFKVAADAYRDCLDAGADNARIYQNLGACLVMAGDVRGARAAFDCAERRGGATPSTERGLKAARAKQTNNPDVELSPARIFLRPHVYWSVDTRLICAAALWSLLWLFALLPAGALRRYLLSACFVAFCAVAVSVGVSLVEEHHAKEVLHAQD